MSDDRKKPDWQIAAGVTFALVVMVALGLYVRCYYKLGAVGGVYLDPEGPGPAGPATVRVYNAKWQATLFTPAGKVESLLRGRPVFIEFGNVRPSEDWEE